MILTVTLNVAIDKRYVVSNFKVNEVNRVKECTYSAGGKGLNVSRVGAIAGEEITATGFVGGHAGAYVIEELEKWGIKSDFINVRGESRSCINIYDEENKTQTEFLEPGVTVTKEDQKRLLDKYEKLVEDHSIVTISGSVPKGVASQIYLDMINIAKKRGKKVILDTSGKLLEDAVLAKPTMIKPNIDEIQMLAGREIKDRADLIRMAEDLQRQGIEIVVVSLGKEGSIIVSDQGIFQAIVPKIEAVNTVGCGDSMIAGFAIGLRKNLDIIDMIKLASAISAANALREETGFYIKEDMEALLSQVKVMEL